MIYDLKRRPDAIRPLWNEIQGFFQQHYDSSCTFVISNEGFIYGLGLVDEHQHALDLRRRYSQDSKGLIRAKTDNLLNFHFGPVLLSEGLKESVRNKIVASAESLQGSVSAVSLYLEYLFKTLSLSSVKAIEQTISGAPATEKLLYQKHVILLRSKDSVVLNWVKTALSWILAAARPLRVEELSVAAAVSSNGLQYSEVRKTMSMDVERDLRTHLEGLVTVENRHVFVVSPLARSVIREEMVQLCLDTDCSLTRLCLKYLTVVLTDERPEAWQMCLAYVASKHYRQVDQDPVLDFLDYACRFWPTHFLRVENPNEIL